MEAVISMRARDGQTHIKDNRVHAAGLANLAVARCGARWTPLTWGSLKISISGVGVTCEECRARQRGPTPQDKAEALRAIGEAADRFRAKHGKA